MATNFYIEKTGSDANSGLTKALAKLTAASAVTASANDDILNFGVGTWAENISARRHYQGVSYFKTIISAVTSTWATTMAFTNIRVNQISGGTIASGTYTYNNAWLDWSSYTPAYVISGGTINATKSIFTGPPGGSSNYFWYGGTLSFNGCVLYNTKHTTTTLGAFLAPSTVSMRNTIMSSSASLAIALGSGAFALEEYNRFYAPAGAVTLKPGGAYGTGTAEGNPFFRDPAGFDFRLAENSPSIGTGHV